MDNVKELVKHKIAELCDLQVSEMDLLQVGVPKDFLGSGADYEWLFRYFLLVDFRIIERSNSVSYRFDEAKRDNTDDYFTYAYILSHYYEILKEICVFDSFFTSVYSNSICVGMDNQFLKNVSELRQHEMQEKGYKGPIIVLKGDSVCGDVLTCFSSELYGAFLDRGEPCILINMESTEQMVISAERALRWKVLVSLNPRLVIGFHTTCFAEEMPEGMYVGNMFKSRKIQFLFDHPLILMYYGKKHIQGLTVLTLDTEYKKFIDSYMPYIDESFFLPPAGMEYPQKTVKKYALTFIGRYYDYRKLLSSLDSLPIEEANLGLELFEFLVNHPESTEVNALEEIFKRRYDTKDISLTLYRLRVARNAANSYFREKVVEEIVNAGIEIDVFSEGWRDAPFAHAPNLHIHDEVDYYNNIRILSESIATLNVFAGHKGGMTERVANAALNRCLCFTDSSIYLTKNPTEGVITFSLERIQDVPGLIMSKIFDIDVGEREDICIKAYDNAKKHHLWGNRVDFLIELLEGDADSNEQRTMEFT